MNVLGIGIDIVETERIRAMISRHGVRFLDRVFTAGERAYCEPMRDPAPYFAARFAAKEAVSKAFGTGIGAEIAWLDIEVVRAASGAPSISLTEAGTTLLRKLNASGLLISLSHSEQYAIAQAMLISGEQPLDS